MKQIDCCAADESIAQHTSCCKDLNGCGTVEITVSITEGVCLMEDLLKQKVWQYSP